MNRTDQAKSQMEQLSVQPNQLSATFPEFEAVKNNFLYGEIRSQGDLTLKQRYLITIATLVTVEGNDLEEQLKSALNQGIDPIEIQEVFHQAAPYIGFAKAETGLRIFLNVLIEQGISLPLAPQATVTKEDRLEKGIDAQKSLFGSFIDGMRANAPENQKFMQDYLSAYCFGDTYTRTGLDLKTRELLTFIFIISLGGCDSQAKSHVMGNLGVGNGPDLLFNAVAQSLPYIGFPRTLNAYTAINETLKMQEQNK